CCAGGRARATGLRVLRPPPAASSPPQDLEFPDRQVPPPPRWAQPRGSHGCARDQAHGCGRYETTRRALARPPPARRARRRRGRKCPAPRLRHRSPSPSAARSSGEAPAAAWRRAPGTVPGAALAARWVAKMGSSCRSLVEHRDPSIALETEGDTPGIFRVVEERNDFLAELPRRQRRTEASQELFGLHVHGVRISVGARVADPG